MRNHQVLNKGVVWSFYVLERFLWQEWKGQNRKGKKVRAREFRRVVIVAIHKRRFKTWNRMAALGNANLLNLRFSKCFHHWLFSPYVLLQEFVRIQFGECWLNSTHFFDVFILSLHLILAKSPRSNYYFVSLHPFESQIFHSYNPAGNHDHRQRYL